MFPKQHKAINISSILFLMTFSIKITDGNSGCINVPISTEESIRLDCDDPSTSRNQWKHENYLLFANQNAISRKFAGSMELCTNYSLIIHPLTKEHEGRYVCIRNSQVLIQYCLEIQSAPNMSIVIGEGNETTITVAAGSGLALRCFAMGATPQVHLTLTVNNLNVDSEEEVRASMKKNEFDKPMFDTITTTTYLPDKGMQNVTCFTRGHFRETKIKTFFTVIKSDIPDVFVTVNGKNGTNDLYLEAGKEIVIECEAFSTNLLKNLTWEFGKALPASVLTSSSSQYLPENQTYHHKIVLKYHPNSEQECFTCTAETEVPTLKNAISVHYFTYVPPVIQILVDGEIIERVLSIPRGKEVQLRCLANGSRPSVNLHIKSSNIDVSSTKSNNLAYIDMNYRAYEQNASITCFATSSIKGQERQKTIYVEATNGKGTRSEEKQISNFVVYIGLACLLIMANITCVGILQIIKVSRKRSRLRKPVNANGMFLPEQTPRTDASYTESPMLGHAKGIQSECHPLGVTLGKSDKDEANRLSLDEEDYYSVLEESNQDYRMFHLKDIRIIFNLKKGSIFSRSVGMLGESNGSARCVVLSTVNDESEHTIGIKWSSYVQRLLELPDADGLVKPEGLCIGGATLYLISEYLACGTLDEYLTSKEPLDDLSTMDKFKECDRFGSIMGVLSGMEVIHSYGFLHPGLSKNKILVSDKGQLKIYDFCLSNEAPRMLSIMKNQISRDMNVLPPEALSRNEYTTASDVWSIAVIIKEMITKGFLPCEHLKDLPNMTTATKDALYDEWYLNSGMCKENDTVISRCLNKDYSERPTMRELRSQLEKISKMVSFHHANSDSTAPDLYIPMKGCEA